MSDIGDNFASAAMMRILALGLKQEGIDLDVPASSGARVPIPQKRKVLDEILARHGPVSLLRVSDAVRKLPPEPLAQALLKAETIADLHRRWTRMEAFTHGRHRMQFKAKVRGTFVLCHQARSGSELPSQAETLLVVGVLTNLMEMVSRAAVDVATEDGTIWRRKGSWQPPSVVGRDLKVVVQVSEATATQRQDSASFVETEDTTARIRTLLSADPLHKWYLGDVADKLCLSQRSLQRHLAQQSTTFSRLIAEVRLQCAAQFLCEEPGMGLAEVGFLSGYSDQAHFTRSFSQHVGLSPQVYRNNL
ncbi:helix-turn-helix transcriptional regulator [Shimia sp. MIT1388]|uniref:helix-turn-helix transcriptional regulator n=1 Tax=Shimia sp. MIT1388 TaxID=3096992 RepID=UPI00399BBC16